MDLEQTATRFPGFEIVTFGGDGGLLGRGASGSVYHVRDVRMDVEFAFKYIEAAKLVGELERHRLEEEIRLQASLRRHPGIVRIDRPPVDFPDGACGLVLEYCNAGSLADHIASHGPLPPDRVMLILLQAASALASAHEKKLIHRDIKPGNFLVHLVKDDDGDVGQVEIKIGDFGLVKQHGDEPELTRQDAGFEGTVAYSSPEQLKRQGVDERSDLFSLGVTAWYLVLGKSPFEGLNEYSIIMERGETAKSYESSLSASLQGGARQIIARLIEKDPANRFQSAAELYEAVNAWLHERQFDSMPVWTNGETFAPYPKPKPAKLDSQLGGEPSEDISFEQFKAEYDWQPDPDISSPLGQAGRGRDSKGDEVLLTRLLRLDRAGVDQISVLVGILRKAALPCLLNPDLRRLRDAAVLIEPARQAMSLLSFIRAGASRSLSDCAPLLLRLAGAFDHAASLRLPAVANSPADIELHPLTDLARPEYEAFIRSRGQAGNLAATVAEDWGVRLRPVFRGGYEASSQPSETASPDVTVPPSRPDRFNYQSAFGFILYWVLATRDPGKRYHSILSLSENANRLLQSILTGKCGEETCVSCLYRLAGIEGVILDSYGSLRTECDRLAAALDEQKQEMVAILSHEIWREELPSRGLVEEEDALWRDCAAACGQWKEALEGLGKLPSFSEVPSEHLAWAKIWRDQAEKARQVLCEGVREYASLLQEARAVAVLASEIIGIRDQGILFRNECDSLVAVLDRQRQELTALLADGEWGQTGAGREVLDREGSLYGGCEEAREQCQGALDSLRNLSPPTGVSDEDIAQAKLYLQAAREDLQVLSDGGQKYALLLQEARLLAARAGEEECHRKVREVGDRRRAEVHEEAARLLEDLDKPAFDPGASFSRVERDASELLGLLRLLLEDLTVPGPFWDQFSTLASLIKKSGDAGRGFLDQITSAHSLAIDYARQACAMAHADTIRLALDSAHREVRAVATAQGALKECQKSLDESLPALRALRGDIDDALERERACGEVRALQRQALLSLNEWTERLDALRQGAVAEETRFSMPSAALQPDADSVISMRVRLDAAFKSFDSGCEHITAKIRDARQIVQDLDGRETLTPEETKAWNSRFTKAEVKIKPAYESAVTHLAKALSLRRELLNQSAETALSTALVQVSDSSLMAKPGSLPDLASLNPAQLTEAAESANRRCQEIGNLREGLKRILNDFRESNLDGVHHDKQAEVDAAIFEVGSIISLWKERADWLQQAALVLESMEALERRKTALESAWTATQASQALRHKTLLREEQALVRLAGQHSLALAGMADFLKRLSAIPEPNHPTGADLAVLAISLGQDTQTFLGSHAGDSFQALCGRIAPIAAQAAAIADVAGKAASDDEDRLATLRAAAQTLSGLGTTLMTARKWQDQWEAEAARAEALCIAGRYHEAQQTAAAAHEKLCLVSTRTTAFPSLDSFPILKETPAAGWAALADAAHVAVASLPTRFQHIHDEASELARQEDESHQNERRRKNRRLAQVACFGLLALATLALAGVAGPSLYQSWKDSKQNLDNYSKKPEENTPNIDSVDDSKPKELAVIPPNTEPQPPPPSYSLDFSDWKSEKYYTHYFLPGDVSEEKTPPENVDGQWVRISELKDSKLPMTKEKFHGAQLVWIGGAPNSRITIEPFKATVVNGGEVKKPDDIIELPDPFYAHGMLRMPVRKSTQQDGKAILVQPGVRPILEYLCIKVSTHECAVYRCNNDWQINWVDHVLAFGFNTAVTKFWHYGTKPGEENNAILWKSVSDAYGSESMRADDHTWKQMEWKQMLCFLEKNKSSVDDKLETLSNNTATTKEVLTFADKSNYFSKLMSEFIDMDNEKFTKPFYSKEKKGVVTWDEKVSKELIQGIKSHKKASLKIMELLGLSADAAFERLIKNPDVRSEVDFFERVVDFKPTLSMTSDFLQLKWKINDPIENSVSIKIERLDKLRSDLADEGSFSISFLQNNSIK